MRLITTQQMVAGVAEKWREQYGGRWPSLALRNGETSSKAIHDRLLALPPGATADDVAAIIGHASGWALPYCNECRKDADAVVLLGEDPPDYDSSTVTCCLPCLRSAAALDSAAPETPQ